MGASFKLTPSSINFVAQPGSCVVFIVRGPGTKFRFEDEKSTGKIGGGEVYHNGGNSGQGQLMPRNGCNERGPGSPHGNDLCTGVTRPHGPIKSDIGAGNVLETCLPRSRHPLPGTLVG